MDKKTIKPLNNRRSPNSQDLTEEVQDVIRAICSERPELSIEAKVALIAGEVKKALVDQGEYLIKYLQDKISRQQPLSPTEFASLFSRSNQGIPTSDKLALELRKCRDLFLAINKPTLHQYDFSNADLSSADLNEANFTECNLTNANLHRAKLYMTELSHANLTGANLSFCRVERARLSQADLSNASLEGSFLLDTHLAGTNLQCSNLTNTTIQGGRLDKACLRGAILLQTSIQRVPMADITLDQSYQMYLDPSHYPNLIGPNINLYGCNFSQRNLSNFDLSYCTLVRTRLTQSQLVRTNLSYSNLTFADIREADLTNANLSYTTLHKANLSGANLTSSILSGAKLQLTNLEGAKVTCIRGIPASLPEGYMLVEGTKYNAIVKV